MLAAETLTLMMALLGSHTHWLLTGPEQQGMVAHSSFPCLHFVKFKWFYADFTVKSKNLSSYP